MFLQRPITALAMAFAASAAAADEVSITFLNTGAGANYASFWNEVMERANEELPFEIKYVTGEDVIISERLRAQSDEEIDFDVIFIRPEFALRALEEGFPLTSLHPSPLVPNAQSIKSELIDTVQGIDTDGKLIPFWRAQYVLFFDTEKVKNAPTSWKEWVERKDEYCGKIGFIATDAGSSGGRTVMFDFFRAFGVDWTQPFEEVQKSEEWKQAAEIFEDFSTCFHTPPASGGPQLFEQMMKGDVWITNYVIDYTLWSQERGRVPETFASTFLAEGANGLPFYYIVPANIPDDRKEAAAQFVNFLISDWVQLKMFTEQYQYPSVESVWDQVPEETWKKAPHPDNIVSTQVENAEGYSWIRENGMQFTAE
ncbi:MAG: extracellular solute-binding protein [Pseudomonadota bacterium]